MKRLHSIPTCEECILEHISVFKTLSREEIEQLNYEKGCNIYKRGNYLFHEGAHMNGFYCVHKGIIKLFKTGTEGKEQIIRFAQKGDIIGYRSVLSGEQACTTARVIEDAIVCFIPASSLMRLMKNNAEFSMALMKRTCKELGEANKFILDIAQKTVRERLAEILLLLKDTFDLDEDNILQISLTREELANLVGTATESVIRLLSEFKSDNLIALKGRKIKFVDEKRLIRTANMLR